MGDDRECDLVARCHIGGRRCPCIHRRGVVEKRRRRPFLGKDDHHVGGSSPVHRNVQDSSAVDFVGSVGTVVCLCHERAARAGWDVTNQGRPRTICKLRHLRRHRGCDPGARDGHINHCDIRNAKGVNHYLHRAGVLHSGTAEQGCEKHPPETFCKDSVETRWRHRG